MGLLAALGMPGLEDALLGSSATSQASQPSGAQGLLGSQPAFGSQQPITMTPEQYKANQNSLGGIIGAFSHGTLPGLAQLVGGDPNATAAGYNQYLAGNQQVGIQGLGIPRAQFQADLMAGKIDPVTGQYYPGMQPSAQPTPQSGPLPTMGLYDPANANSGAAQIAASPLGQQAAQAGNPALAGDFPSAPGMAPGGLLAPPSNAPPAAGAPPQGGGSGNTFLGLPLPRGVSPGAARMSYALDPSGKGLMDIINKALTLTNVRPGGAAVDSYGNPVYQQPTLPQGMVYQQGQGGGAGQALPVSGANVQHAALAGIDQSAIGGREAGIASHNAYLETGPGGLGTPWGGTRQPALPTGQALPGGAPTPSAAPSAGNPPPSVPPVINTDPSQPTPTAQGTVIPPLAQQAPIPRDTASYKEFVKAAQPKDTEMSALPLAAQPAIQRMDTIANMFKLTQPGMFATERATIGAGLIALGVPKNNVPAMLGDPAAVQLALHENAVKTLQTLKATTSRFTQMEFKTLSGNTNHPDLQPETNLQQLAEDIGMLKQGAALGTDWRSAKFSGWRNPIDFEAAWSSQPQNALGNFVDQEKARIGPLKGMPGGPGSSALAPAAPVTKSIGGKTYRYVP